MSRRRSSAADQARALEAAVAALAARPLHEPAARRLREALAEQAEHARQALRADPVAGSARPPRGLRVVSSIAGEPALAVQDAPPAAVSAHRPASAAEGSA